MAATNTLPITNIKFIIEGRRRDPLAAIPTSQPLSKAHKDLLKADVILISDTSMVSPSGRPASISASAVSAISEVEITGPNRDLHSGVYGGAVANPITILAKMIASCHDGNNHITIPGFYDDVLEATAAERKLMSQAPLTARSGVQERPRRKSPLGRKRIYDQRTDRHPPDDRTQRNLGWLHRRGRQNSPPLQSPRQDLRPPRPQPGIQSHHGKIIELLPHHRPRRRDRQSGGTPRRRALHDPDRQQGLPGRRPSDRSDVPQSPDPRPRRRQHPDLRALRKGIRYKDRLHGLRPGQRQPPFPQRKIQPREFSTKCIFRDDLLLS